MPEPSPLNPLQSQILAAIEPTPEGLKISQIEALLPQPVARRTLVRRLAELKQRGDIMTQGHGAGTRYLLKPAESGLLLSEKGNALRAQIKQSLQSRTPVAYQPDFLYRYQPNESYYLPEQTRQHLHRIGQQFDREAEPGTYAKSIMQKLLIDLSWNSSRLEGNTYSLLETERLIEFGAIAEGKTAFEVQMIMNHKDAIEFMMEHAQDPKLDQQTVLNIHALLSNNLLQNSKARGALRKIPVGIGKTVYHPPEIPQLISACFSQLLDAATRIKDPFEQAFFILVQIPYLQPFEDVNKRVSRLAANIPLMRHNLSPLSFVDVPKDDYISGLLAIYELNKIELMRDVFVWAYERSAQQYQLVHDTLGEPNLLVMRFRKDIFELVNQIVSKNISGAKIIETIEQWAAAHVSASDQAQFIRVVQQEVASLHEGNIAVYRIKPEVFRLWCVKG